MLSGIDTSDYNAITSYMAVAAGGAVDFWFNKATEGVSYVNPNYRRLHAGVRSARIPYGAYHFFHGGADGASQARAFLKAIDGYEGQLLPVVDCEAEGTGGVSGSTYLANLVAFIAAVDATLAGKRTIIYFEYSFWIDFLEGTDEFSGHPAFPAAYNNDSELSMAGTGWANWTLWQYSDGTNLAPISGIAGEVDRDRLNGDDISVILRAG